MDLKTAISNVDRSLAQYLESNSGLWNNYVDPREAYLTDGEYWTGIGAGFTAFEERPYRTCEELFQIQSIARVLSRDNEFCINGHTNRVNYTVGKCHAYKINPIDADVDLDTSKRVMEVLNQILKANKWGRRQKEIKWRDDRDGETIIRKFKSSDGLMRFRFVEPRSLRPPSNPKPHESYGVRTVEGDDETPTDYHINNEWVPAGLIQHRKHNVDSSFKRGYPTFFPVRHNLTRAAKLLRNMSVATEIQTAIALIRRHQQSSSSSVRTFIERAAQQNSAKDGETVLHYEPGSIIDAPRGQEYDIPKQMDVSKTVAALAAELRAIASRLVMPEFMLSSDASNGNFSSTMVAEGPAVKNFECIIDAQEEDDTELLNDALRHAADAGLISHDDLAQVTLEAVGPSVQVRDALKEAQVRQADIAVGILSKKTASAKAGYDYEQEQTNIETEIS